MKRLLAISALCLAMIVTATVVSAGAAAVDVGYAAAMQKQGALLLDVREPDEYAAVHAPGSMLMPLGQLPSRLGELQAYRNKPIAVICRSGRRSARAVEILRNAGFTEAVNVEGGMNAWESAGLPVIRGN